MSIWVNENGTAARKDAAVVQEGGASSLTDLDDVSIDTQTLANGQVLKYNSTSGEWENGEGGTANAMLTDGSNAADTVSLNKNLEVVKGFNAYSVSAGTIYKPSGSNQTITFTCTETVRTIVSERLKALINTTDTVYILVNGENTFINIQSVYENNGVTMITAKLVEDDSSEINITSGDRNMRVRSYATSNSVSAGKSCVSKGTNSHSEGSSSVSIGNYSHAEGSATCTTYNGTAAHSEGQNTLASGLYSHAEGNMSTASAAGSHAEGLYTVAGYQYQHASGQYNNNKSDTYLEVGNGTAINARSNAFEVTTDGFIRTHNNSTKIAFGVDANGNYGYIKPGADTVYPFKSDPVLQQKTVSGFSKDQQIVTPDINYDGLSSVTVQPLEALCYYESFQVSFSSGEWTKDYVTIPFTHSKPRFFMIICMPLTREWEGYPILVAYKQYESLSLSDIVAQDANMYYSINSYSEKGYDYIGTDIGSRYSHDMPMVRQINENNIVVRLLRPYDVNPFTYYMLSFC